MYDVCFIRTANLNQELYDFLLSMGYAESDVNFILRHKKIPRDRGNYHNLKWETYYTPELKQLVRQKDWLFFRMFPEFDC